MMLVLFLLSYYKIMEKTKTLGSAKYENHVRFESTINNAQQWKQKDRNGMKYVNAIEKNHRGSDETPCFDILLL